MFFERCLYFDSPDEWTIIDHAILLAYVPDEKITMMIQFKTTIRIGGALYRRYIPMLIWDWAKKDNLAPRPIFNQT